MDPEDHRSPHLDVNVGGAALDGRLQDAPQKFDVVAHNSLVMNWPEL